MHLMGTQAQWIWRQSDKKKVGIQARQESRRDNYAIFNDLETGLH